ncbi:MAG: hypothetical protein QXH96_00370 [Candidatus Geothermarchaeota archaeon]
MFKKNITSEELAKKYDHIIKQISIYRTHLKNAISSIERKIAVYKQRCEYYKLNNESVMANVYLREIDVLYILKVALNAIDINLHAISLRIDTLKIVVPALLEIRNMIATMNNTIKDIKKIADKFGQNYKELFDKYIDIFSIAEVPEIHIDIPLVNEEAIELIKAIEEKVGEELSRKLPSISINLDDYLVNLKKGLNQLREKDLITGEAFVEL